jgi:hypothetical protein
LKLYFRHNNEESVNIGFQTVLWTLETEIFVYLASGEKKCHYCVVIAKELVCTFPFICLPHGNRPTVTDYPQNWFSSLCCSKRAIVSIDPYLTPPLIADAAPLGSLGRVGASVGTRRRDYYYATCELPESDNACMERLESFRAPRPKANKQQVCEQRRGFGGL